MFEILHSWELNKEFLNIVFVSPVPALLLMAAGTVNDERLNAASHISQVFVFHNDRREKIELPDGRIISRVADTGWRLISDFGVI
jgi:hypothetical protein